ncbi:hypothetical protein EYC84_004719 [Monilinia fructicola]|uniref:Cation/H+ exchanger transmembrane domain-containing protein n=1 Tax=Monilinia fructicola TaxID=38448 RepID=A0A5M9K6C0_MONFR|nr:hypothetical protein EYC84_004719 [Monilinia fructicola]
MFVYFGSIIPWDQFQPSSITPHVKPWTLTLFLILVLLFRRIPILLLTKSLIPDIRTYHEALFAGHFGPMGVGALFLVMEARAQLETGTSLPLPSPEFPVTSPVSEEAKAIWIIWPVICFAVLGSTMVHGLSVVVITLGSHFSRKEGERAPLLEGETEGLRGMIHEGGNGESEPEISASEAE